MNSQKIIIRGAREHNLKNIDLVIPRDRLVVITGVSGSGKSSLAFDTIYAEGQRRYMESLSAYARQFLGQMEKPDVDYIEGLSPAICIDQKGAPHNPRSTVGTITEIHDFLRLFFARVGKPHCPKCGRPVSRQSVPQIVDSIKSLESGSRIMIVAPVVSDRKGEHQAILKDLVKAGFVRVRVDGEIKDLSQEISLDKNKKHTIEAVVDRIVVGASEDGNRISDSVETALRLGGGIVLISVIDKEEILFSEHFACVYCQVNLGEIAPRSFSFNSPHGACPSCTGLGHLIEIDPELVIPNRDLSLAEGAIQPWFRTGGISAWYMAILKAMAKDHGFSLSTPVKKLKQEHIEVILYGNGGKTTKVGWEDRYGNHQEYFADYEGVIPNLKRRYRETESDMMRTEIGKYTSSRPCPDCGGKRLKPEALAVTITAKNIMEVTSLTILEALDWIYLLRGENGHEACLTPRELTIGNQIMKEIRSRLGFLKDIGLGYITLDRPSATLSGGEAQRIRLATQIGSALVGVLYICDEPTVGLHPADSYRLVETLKRLRDLGNTIIVVEHDESVMKAADFIVDMGPGAGENGGWVVASGTLEDIENCPDSITGLYLSGKRNIPLPERRRNGSGKTIEVKGARENNLKSIDVSIPLGQFVCVTGVSGSGKSTLVNDVLYKRLAQVLNHAKERPGKCDRITGIENIDKVVNIDQAPIGRTSRSNPATYTGTFTLIRELFAEVPEARFRGYRPGRFSFNIKGGRCEACEGEGYVKIEMQFLPDVTVPCEVCKGRRYNREALEVLLKGKSIADVLDLSISEAKVFFDNFPRLKGKLKTLEDVGLGYIKLGQPAPTLSGGEAQRVKLATELSKRATGKTLYILDEPTTGLSFSDVACLLVVLNRLADSGNSVLVIEHNMDIIKNADYIIDLGPGAGDAGGYLISGGNPQEIMSNKDSLTGQYLAEELRATTAV